MSRHGNISLMSNGMLYTPLPIERLATLPGNPHQYDRRYQLIYGYDGQLDFYFIEIYDLRHPKDDEPTWDSTFSEPGGFHKDFDSLFGAAEKAGYKIDPSVRKLMEQVMTNDKAGYVDLRTPAMKEFQEQLRKDLFGDGAE